MKIPQILEDTKLLLQTKSWCQGHYAENEKGRVVAVENPTACRFCLEGALIHIIPKDSQRTFRTIVRRLEKFVGVAKIYEWNDSEDRKFEDVIDLLNTASKWDWWDEV